MRLMLLALAVCAVGCSSMDYQGTSYSSRTLRDNPGFKDYYLGMNAKFALDRPSDYRTHPYVEPNSLPASSVQTPSYSAIDGK